MFQPDGSRLPYCHTIIKKRRRGVRTSQTWFVVSGRAEATIISHTLSRPWCRFLRCFLATTTYRGARPLCISARYFNIMSASESYFFSACFIISLYLSFLANPYVGCLSLIFCFPNLVPLPAHRH